ncbi:MAG: efflux RND transporter periplasmic adaptor subunit [Phycisphaeraceae bacterium]|nr:efflux RND transporter periplasmic adaptor subunit [Phycisphaeraceae bacterium]
MSSGIASGVRTGLKWIIAAAVIVLVLVWLAGAFHRKTQPGAVAAATQPATGAAMPVIVREVPRVVQALGTVRAVQETAVGSQLLAKVKKVHVSAGQRVSKGDLLVELDQADIAAQVRRAEANVDAGKARLAQATSDLDKTKKLQDSGAATARELGDQQRVVDVTQADLRAAEEALKQARAQLDYATIRAPIDGVVIDKQVQEGDLAKPGQTVVTLYDPHRLQLIAPVPERVALSLKVGDAVGVEIDAIDLSCQAQISEIVPEASSASRALLVKVTGPCPPGVYSGMFGRMLISQGKRQQMVIPADSVSRIGQLDMVLVQAGEVPQRRVIRVGQATSDGMVEVLSGLLPGESVYPSAQGR